MTPVSDLVEVLHRLLLLGFQYPKPSVFEKEQLTTKVWIIPRYTSNWIEFHFGCWCRREHIRSPASSRCRTHTPRYQLPLGCTSQGRIAVHRIFSTLSTPHRWPNQSGYSESSCTKCHRLCWCPGSIRSTIKIRLYKAAKRSEIQA